MHFYKYLWRNLCESIDKIDVIHPIIIDGNGVWKRSHHDDTDIPPDNHPFQIYYQFNLPLEIIITIKKLVTVEDNKAKYEFKIAK